MSRKECCSHESTVISQQNKIVILFFVGIAVSGLMLRLKAKELSDDPAFKASRGWYEKWKRRHSVSRVPHTVDSLNVNHEQGCALAEPCGPWRLTFALGRLENLRFFIQILYWAS